MRVLKTGLFLSHKFICTMGVSVQQGSSTQAAFVFSMIDQIFGSSDGEALDIACHEYSCRAAPCLV